MKTEQLPKLTIGTETVTFKWAADRRRVQRIYRRLRREGMSRTMAKTTIAQLLFCYVVDWQFADGDHLTASDLAKEN